MKKQALLLFVLFMCFSSYGQKKITHNFPNYIFADNANVYVLIKTVPNIYKNYNDPFGKRNIKKLSSPDEDFQTMFTDTLVAAFARLNIQVKDVFFVDNYNVNTPDLNKRMVREILDDECSVIVTISFKKWKRSVKKGNKGKFDLSMIKTRSFGFNKFGDFGDNSIYYQTQSSKKLENYFVQMKKIIDEKPQDYFVDSIKENPEDAYLELYDTTVYDHLFKESLVHYKLPETDVLKDDTLLVIVKDVFMGMHTAMCRKSLSKYYPYKYRIVSFYQNPLFVPQKCANELKSGSRYVLIIKSDLITSSKSDGIGEKKKTKRVLETVYVYALKDLQTNEVYYAGKPMSGFGFTPVRQYMALNQILRKMSRKYDW